MPPAPPHTLSVKRKRNEAPVDELVIESKNDNTKRIKRTADRSAFSWKLVPNPNTSVPSGLLSPSTTDRRFFLDPAAASCVKHVLVERPAAGTPEAAVNRDLQAAATLEPTPADTPRPRKRPGAGSALNRAKETLNANTNKNEAGPSEDDVRKFEEFSKSVERTEAKPKPKPLAAPPLKYKPKVPALRFKDRHPEKAAALEHDALEHDALEHNALEHNALEHDAMEIDSEEYVYDTYVRQDIVPDANGTIPEPQGTVGFIVLEENDEDIWNGDEGSDKEFATDDEDENAEDHYTNDYPEDELSSDDEYDRNPYKRKYRHRHGADNEEYDLDEYDEDEDAHVNMRSDEDEDDYHSRVTSEQVKRPSPGYWGQRGE